MFTANREEVVKVLKSKRTVYKRYGVKSLALFGSAARNSLRKKSDVDILVEFMPDMTPSLLDFAGMQLEMSSLIGREAQLHTPPMLSRYCRHEVLKEARLLHAA